MALILTVVLIGVVAALTVSAQISVALLLRQARTRHFRNTLRLAAADAAMDFAQMEANRQGTGGTAAPSRTVTPAGIETEVTTHALSETEASFLPLARDMMAAKPGLKLIQTRASASGAVEQVSCLIGKDPSGKIRIMGWLEDK